MPTTQNLLTTIGLLSLSMVVASNSFAQDYYQTDHSSVSQSIVQPIVQSANGLVQSELTLDSLVGMAYAGNPTITQAQAHIEAAKGAAHQAGLRPNPTVGYETQFDRIGGAPNETWGGGFASQEFVTGGKLRLSRAKWCQRVQIAQTNLEAQRQRIFNDVAIQFYRTLAAQRSVGIAHELVANAQDNLQTYREMLNVGQTNQPGILQAEVSLQREQLNLRQAEYEFQHAWRLLKSVVNAPNLESSILAGILEPQESPLSWEQAWEQLLGGSPELTAAHQKIRHDQITVARERAEPIPNITASVTSIKNFDADLGQTTLNFGIPLPVFDRNRGTVRQAQADLAQSKAEVTRMELDLQTRLATQFRDYQLAWDKIVEFDRAMLPKSKQAYDLLHESYKARRAPWPDVLMAQRTYLNLRSEQVKNLAMYRESDIAIRGMLLTGGLSIPNAPIGGGHIDSVAKPR